jgi:hypothetical protein
VARGRRAGPHLDAWGRGRHPDADAGLHAPLVPEFPAFVAAFVSFSVFFSTFVPSLFAAILVRLRPQADGDAEGGQSKGGGDLHRRDPPILIFAN